MSRFVKLSALAMMFAGTVAAAPEPPLQVSYPTDGSLTCEGLNTEVLRMDGIMGSSAQAAASAQGTATAVNAGASVAINGALYSGALGRVPGLGMMGNAAAGLARQRAAAKEAQAKETIRNAETRRAMLMGIYQGKGCANAPAAAPVEAAAPSS